MPGHPALRDALDEACTLREPIEHRARIEILRTQFCHCIEITEDPPAPDSARPTCYAFAFGLAYDTTYRRLMIERRAAAKTPIHSGFVADMLNEGVLAERVVLVRSGDIVVYFDADGPAHAGVVVEALEGLVRVRSKWSAALDVHEHDLWEVPASYGDAVRYYIAPDPIVVLRRLQT